MLLDLIARAQVQVVEVEERGVVLGHEEIVEIDGALYIGQRRCSDVGIDDGGEGGVCPSVAEVQRLWCYVADDACHAQALAVAALHVGLQVGIVDAEKA